MLEKILDYERELFLALNGSNSTFWDHFMWLYSGKIVWLPLAVVIIFLLVYKKDWRESILILIAIALVITLCDQFASHFIKPTFMRLRPTHHPDFMNEVDTVFGYRGGRYGFISSHAANAFGFAMFMTLLFRYRPLFSTTIFIWAFITAYTRIYLGVHFISDIIPGALVGIGFGFLVYAIYSRVRVKIIGRGGREVPPASSLYSVRRERMIVVAILVTVGIIMLLNVQLVNLLRDV
ncbi:undecaprenyl-diphosphatase [Parabacteroides sp. PFB2-12]|uniref:phosphatase PAP2 family protein n=1 Tax=unclassified Parabacteroides TaxID=2649774 RepID=UPI0024746F43|nr:MULTISPECIES: phosphatase PAP2 family protein [unclassified Parabacteroides]MDH6343659.1 undecaprenyl-diphosphatase [Parabacteroides sp. PM6-13]MDH6391295.1 undecaprenyl-diphosphatase [Parabacteroides sp. PFB2-12]